MGNLLTKFGAIEISHESEYCLGCMKGLKNVWEYVGEHYCFPCRLEECDIDLIEA